MAKVNKTASDSEEWSRGHGEFYVTSRSTLTNRRTGVTSKTYKTNSNVGSDSESRQVNRAQYPVYRSEDEIPYRESKNATAIHVDVRPSYPPVDVPIQRIATTGNKWVASEESRNYVYPSDALIVSPPTVSTGHRRQRRTLRQGSETRVVTEMTIPPLESPSLGQPRNQRSYSTDIYQEKQETSQRRRQREQLTLNNNFRRMNLEEPVRRPRSAPRRRRDTDHYHHCHCHRQAKNRSSSRLRARDIYGTTRGMPMALGYPTPAYPIYPDWSGGFASASPAAFYYPEDYVTPMPGVPYLASPAIPIHYSMPRRYSSTYGRRPSIPVSTLTPGTAPVFPRSSRIPPQYHCSCCPNGGVPERGSRIFNFDGDLSEGEGLPPMNPRQYGRTVHLRSHSRQQFAAQGTMSRQTPTEFGIPNQKETPNAVPYGMVSPEATLKESTYTSQKYQNTWNTTIQPKGGVAMPSIHGEVTRDDGFPPDYVDLIDVGIEYTNGMEDGEDGESLPPPDKKVVLQLAENALASANGPTQVAATLKKAMDENFGPVWHVIAGTGAYGSNIASLGGQLLHFKAFGWAFLIWKTSDQQPE